MQTGRGSGILLHITSLPSRFGIGDLGPEAYRFADFLAEAGQKYWQVLPLTPTQAYCGNSPYNSTSAFALNPLFISPEKLEEDGFLEASVLSRAPKFKEGKADYRRAANFKRKILDAAYRHSIWQRGSVEFLNYCEENAFWLDDYALFAALREKFPKQTWVDWPQEIKDRKPEALENARRELAPKIGREKFIQYLFDGQWRDLKNYCANKGINIIGDIPIYVSHDSADVWCNRNMFALDESGRPTVVSGVPPDYFSETGQLWGNPIYRWDNLSASGFGWWVRRFERNMSLADIVRVDHFRGLCAYWEIPAGEKTAMNGRWVFAPVREFLGKIREHFPGLPIIAEDLGVITDDVREVMTEFGLPGMRILVFAFGGDMAKNPYLPHNFIEKCVCYTGTHDTNTAKGWFEKEASAVEKENICKYFSKKIKARDVSWEFIDMLMHSVAGQVILPMQDVLSLGSEARMNRPSLTHGNWQWRLKKSHLSAVITKKLRGITDASGRS